MRKDGPVLLRPSRLELMLEGKSVTWTKTQLVALIQEFHQKFGRPPTTSDLIKLRMEDYKKWPSKGVFMRKGGLKWLTEEAGLELLNRHQL